MCDWPVYGIYGGIDNARRCHHNGLHQAGRLLLCPRHLDTMIAAVTEVMHREARQLIRDGRVTPGGIEEHLRSILAGIEKTRRAARSIQEGTEPCIYFAEREGYVKIGSTTNLTKRLRALAAGGNLLEGMTAGPLNLLATVAGGPEDETRLHWRFRGLRVDPNREWFRYEGGLRRFVEGLR